jgi:hypothetical protein
MALVSRALDYFHIGNDLKKFTTDLDADKHHQMNRLLEQLITLRMLGGDAVSDTTPLNDPALGALFDWDTIAHPSAFWRRLGKMHWVHNLGLERIVTGLSDRVAKTGHRLVAIDSAVATVFGEQIEGAERGYNRCWTPSKSSTPVMWPRSSSPPTWSE